LGGSIAERDGVHDAARPKGKKARNDERAGEQAEHGLAVLVDPVAVGMQHRKREHRQGENREKVDRAE
jgi:2-C-methyl-D-erythritol 4-phosphate cytidylyltransferase